MICSLACEALLTNPPPPSPLEAVGAVPRGERVPELASSGVRALLVPLKQNKVIRLDITFVTLK